MIATISINNEFADIKSIKSLHNNLQKLIDELNKKDLQGNLIEKINNNLNDLNAFEGDKKQYRKCMHKCYFYIQELVKKEMNIVSSSHYPAIWMSIGMGLFGLPIGTIWYAVTQNPVFIPLGIPIGMSIGIAIGAFKMNKAKNENRIIEL